MDVPGFGKVDVRDWLAVELEEAGGEEWDFSVEDAVIARLIENNPAYIRGLLETEDERFGAGALASRYAHTFRGWPISSEPGAHVSE